MDVTHKRSYLLGFTALYWLSALLGWWVAYEPLSAQIRLLLLSVGAATVVVSGVLNRYQRLRLAPIAAGSATIIASAFAAYYLLRQQFAHDAMAGIIGSTLAVLFPLGLGAVVWAHHAKRRAMTIAFAVLSLLCLVGLIATGERGAWLSLLAGVLVAAAFGLWHRSPALSKQGLVLDWLFWISGSLLLLGYLAFLRVPAVAAWVMGALKLSPQSDLFTRWELWNNSLTLLADYPFTGSGLAAPKMVLATYVYINHVASQPHVHNLYLQAGAEQGWLGLFAIAGMVVMALALALESLQSRNTELLGLRLASLASIVTLAIYGLLDAEIYAYATAPLAFVPIAFTLLVRKSARVHQTAHAAQHHGMARTEQRDTSFGQVAFSTVALAVIFGAVWVNWEGFRAAIFTNLGTVSQTRSELSVYQWPEWGIQDQLRQIEGGVDLNEAERFLRVALVFNPENETSLRRFGQIALARGQFEKAESLLNDALQIAPDRRATRQMLGELLAIRGETEQAVAMWQSVRLLDGQIDGRIWWYEQMGNKKAVDNIRLVQSQLN